MLFLVLHMWIICIHHWFGKSHWRPADLSRKGISSSGGVVYAACSLSYILKTKKRESCRWLLLTEVPIEMFSSCSWREALSHCIKFCQVEFCELISFELEEPGHSPCGL